MSENIEIIKEYYENNNIIEYLKNFLIKYGYQYNNQRGWITTENYPLPQDVKKEINENIKAFTIFVNRNSEILKKYDIPNLNNL